MDLRTTYLLHLRPEFSKKLVHSNMSEDERFQNQTLRPILRVQNPILLETFRHYIHKHKDLYYKLNAEKQLKYIEKSIQKDTKLRNTLKGIVIGMFTEREYRFYLERSSAVNKRIMNLVVERIKDQMQYFLMDEEPEKEMEQEQEWKTASAC